MTDCTKKFTVTFMPEGKSAEVSAGATAAEAADAAGVNIGRHCGGAGVCGKCRVAAKGNSPLAPLTPTEKNLLSKEDIAKGYRLSCCAEIQRSGTLYVIDKVSSAGHSILEGFYSDITDWQEGRKGCGIAVDIGTTTVVCYLLDYEKYEAKDRISFLNPQVTFGDDVISRIAYSSTSDESLSKIQKTLTDEMEKNIILLAERNNEARKNISEIIIAANTVMEHLFAGVSPESIGRSPYAPQFLLMPPFAASKIGININEKCTVKMISNVAGYVGADIVAGVAAIDMDLQDKMRLLVDIGTNNEIVIGNKNKMFCCATAAGPALEGARIQYGMRAAEGAVEKVYLDDGKLKYETIGNAKAIGLCGSGLIDAIALLLNEGIIEKSGRFVYPEKCTDVRFAHRLSRTPKGMVQILLTDEENPVYLTQKDVREVQLAVGAIKVGVEVMLEREGIALAQLDEVCLAGAFGNNINIESAVRVGLLPDVPHDRITGIKNSSGLGACMAGANPVFYERTKETAEKMAYVELSSLPDFQKRFVNAMSF